VADPVESDPQRKLLRVLGARRRRMSITAERSPTRRINGSSGGVGGLPITEITTVIESGSLLWQSERRRQIDEGR
jgi:hypothetical protein